MGDFGAIVGKKGGRFSFRKEVNLSEYDSQGIVETLQPGSLSAGQEDGRRAGR
jgi:hypothetical protein